MTAIFIRALSDEDKPAALLYAVNHNSASVFEFDPAEFSNIHGSPFIYWISKTILNVAATCPSFENEDRVTKCGLGTLDDFRFLRLRWEVGDQEKGGWEDFIKGGSRSPWISDIYIKIKWGDAGRELKTFVESRVGSASRKIQAQEYYFRRGITFPRRPLGMGWFSAVPDGVIFADNGPMAFAPAQESLAWLSFFNAVAPHFFMQLMMARGQEGSAQTLTYEVGIVARCPVPKVELPERLAQLAIQAWRLSYQRLAASEQSAFFVLPESLLQKQDITRSTDRRGELAKIMNEIDAIVLDLFEFSPADRATMSAWGSKNEKAVEDAQAGDDDEDENEDTDGNFDELLSWAIGVAFGRFDIRLATGERDFPCPPGPFDPLPTKSPGMLPDGVAPFRASGGILVDDLGHSDDIVEHVAAVYSRLGLQARETLREAISNDVFDAHIKAYSRSRRKAPIYWQFATPSCNYSVWLYVQSFSKDTLYRIQNEYVSPKLAHERRQLDELRREHASEAGGVSQKAVEQKNEFVAELQSFQDEINRVAPLWSPNLDDGVVLNMAPLWRLVPQHKAWQRELKSKWDEIVSGKYDWSHIAMRLWPERVVPKCAADRSLAIAHGLEENFWFEDEDGKWKSYEKPKRPVDALVRERTSNAVKAALKSLLEAPDAAGGAKRTRKSRAA
jgi:hypothetical protein